MSLRPAQDLVEGSSKFSLRRFFEQQQQQQQQQQLLSLPTRSPADFPADMGLPTLHPQREHSPKTAAPPFLRPHTPAGGAGGGGGAATAAHPNQNKFTFTGLMPVTTQIQVQHKILQQHQQKSVTHGAILTKPTALHPDSANEVLRLKAQIVQLNETLVHANANLATTSDSVTRGNKALTTERAQFHAKYASLVKKLDATKAALADVEALPKEDTKNAELLNAKVLELQLENGKLTGTLAKAKAEAAIDASVQLATGAAESPLGLVEETEALAALQEKFTSLSTQHSSLLGTHAELEASFAKATARLDAASANVGEANERAETWEMEVVALREQMEASQLEIAETNSLVDTLDEKLEAARAEAVVVAVESCCPATARCEEMEKAARGARDQANGAGEHECARLHEEWKFLDGLAKRARHSLLTGEPERVMVAHVYAGNAGGVEDAEACFALSQHVGIHPRPMGNPIDKSCLHCAVDTTDTYATDATDATTEMARNASTPEGRTNAFVQAVSKDLKFSMDGSQALYASSSTTGVALRV